VATVPTMRRSASWARGLRALRSALACAGPLASACTEIREFDSEAAADAGFVSAVDGGFARDGGAGAFFTYTFEKRVFRVAAAAGAAPEDLTPRLERVGPGTIDRWLVPSLSGQAFAFSTDRVRCPEVGECLAIASGDWAHVEPVLEGGREISVVGTPAVSDGGDRVVYPAEGGPHVVDLWATSRVGNAWSSAVLLTGASRFAYNDMPAMTFDGARVLFDCGDEAYPESGATSSCEVRLDGSALRVIATPTTIPANRNDFVQFPHDSVDGVLLQGAGDIEGTFPETIWLLPRAGGAPVPIGRALTNAVSPCALRDGRFGALWLTRPGARRSKHELTLLRRDGTVEATLTPDVDVSDIGIGCGG
jgi:hypothetical protein